jgi:hypothetical protein
MPYFADRVKDTTTTTGTGALTLAGSAPSGYQTFPSGLGSAACLVEFCVAGQSGTEWETSIGTFNGTTGLTRDTVIQSSNANALVNFSAGTKDVFVTASFTQVSRANVGRQLALARGYARP